MVLQTEETGISDGYETAIYKACLQPPKSISPQWNFIHVSANFTIHSHQHVHLDSTFIQGAKYLIADPHPI